MHRITQKRTLKEESNGRGMGNERDGDAFAVPHPKEEEGKVKGQL